MNAWSDSKIKASETVENDNEKYHYYESNNHVICMSVSKQKSIRTYPRFIIKSCNKNCCIEGTILYLKSEDAIYPCACGIKKYDLLEIILRKD